LVISSQHGRAADREATPAAFGSRRIVLAVAILMLGALYLTGLTRMGMYGPDEPRYAAIGRAMAQTGEWVTPTLWGEPWFEKPPLLYWMTAVGFKAGLSPDLAPRLPVALLAVSFLVFFWWRMDRVFDETTANCATAILATSAGWLAYSHIAVTDLPLTAFFSAAVLFSLPAGDCDQSPFRIAAAIALGLAVLAKSLPPVVIFLPVLLLDYRNRRHWFGWPLAAFAAVVLPWHVAATMRNGPHFIYVLFIQQQFGRFFSDALQHVRPWWFYGPVFLLLLFPWFPLLPLALRHARDDARTRRLAVVAITGMFFFSASVNKLPGYVLPLLPVTCALMGVALARTVGVQRWIIFPVALLGLLPVAASAVPEAAAHGLRAVRMPWPAALAGLGAATCAGCAIAWGLKHRALPLAVSLVAVGFFWMELTLFPAMDRAGSARILWSGNRLDCAPALPRGVLYGLYYYSEKRIPDCDIGDKSALPLHGSEQTR
jgi:4-amino-4-deoxy-L-arabinose transferase-like glycosyltransferase